MKKPMKILIVAVALFLAMPSARAQLKYVAVVETEVDARSGASVDLTSAEVALITTELRREAVKNLPRGRYNVMTSETVQSMGGAVLEECSDENCVIILGSKIGADYIVRGVISKFKTLLTLSVEIYETDNGNLVASSEPVRSETAADLLLKTAPACADMFKTFIETMSAAATANAYRKPESEPKPQLTKPKPDAGSVQGKKRHTLAAVGLDILGAGILVFGYTRDMSVDDLVGKKLYADAEKPAGQRNVAYAAGALILLSGLSVHIFF